ncbi:cytochrome P450 [Plenodomus tracheiphilus IPT5]|uniref:Cytochrome P450 n=1 Tax=Plenodomus tracheiphilus IPT5 TaxID=1408161 RepID=A0A6A7BLW1_9PLEO|nr:cytochrome P450 [Plenodomus tracheiphilus IPT5]
MSLEFVVYTSLTVVFWYTINAHLVAKPIPGIPYNRFARCMPWGDLITLGWHKFITGEVFSWFSLQCLNKRSPIMQIFLPSFSTTHPTLILADLREIEDVTTKRMSEIDRADVMHTWFGTVAPRATIGLKTSDKIFKDQRRLWNVVLSPLFLRNVAAERFWEGSLKLSELWERQIDLIRQETGKELAFDFMDDIKLATLDGIWKMNVGSELGLLDARLAQLDAPIALRTTWSGIVAFPRAKMPEFYKVLGSLFMCLDWIMQGISPRMYTLFFTVTGILARANERKYKILRRTIETSRQHVRYEKESTDTCALHQVIRRQDSSDINSSDVTTDTALMDELFELLITGHETTASTIAWAIKYLTDNPQKQSQLRASLYAAFPECLSLPLAKDIFAASVPYLDAVIAETLRISNTGPVSFRQTLVQCDILGHTVPAETPVLLITAGPSYLSPKMPLIPENLRSRSSQATLLRSDPKARFSERESDLTLFEPARWLNEDGTFDRDAVQMLPFSSGLRGCFGKRLALLELKIILTILIMRFEFPKLDKRLSGYAAIDGLTRRPASCYIKPVYVKRK